MKKCLICGGNAEYYFEKEFENYDDVLKKAVYYKCSDCGFVFSDTHANLTEEEYSKLNKKYCEYSFEENINDFKHRPPYLQQALLLNIINKFQLCGEKWLDFGCGTKFFERILKDNFNLKIDGYDKYLNKDFVPSKNYYDLVFSSAVLEHITTQDTIEEMISYLNDDGILVFHTLVCENIPKDKNWFYLLPVHSAFFSNKSMSVIMKKYGFSSSAYCPMAKSWILFKDKFIEEKIKSINLSLLNEYLIFKDGFVDYWKGF